MPLGHPREGRRVDSATELLDPRPGVLAELRVGPLRTRRHPDDRDVSRLPAPGEPVQRREELAAW